MEFVSLNVTNSTPGICGPDMRELSRRRRTRLSKDEVVDWYRASARSPQCRELVYLASFVSEVVLYRDEMERTASETIWTLENEFFGAMSLPERHYF